MTMIHFHVIWVPKKCSDKEHQGLVSVWDYVELKDQKGFMDEVVFEMTLGRVAVNDDDGEENASLCEQIKMQREYKVPIVFKE